MQQKNEESEWKMGRGTFMKAVVAAGSVAAAGGAFYLKEPKKAAEAWEEVARVSREILDRMGIEGEHRVELLKSLLKLTGDVRVVDPFGHPEHRRSGPHDHAAMGTACTLFHGLRACSEFPLAAINPMDGIFSPGSPLTSDLAKLFVPTTAAESDPDLGGRLLVNPEALPYHFAPGNLRNLRVLSATTGKERLTYNSGIIRAGEQSVWHPEGIRDSEGWLAADFLLLTVIPTSRTFGGYVALASGAHGPGTRAFELLAHPSFRSSKLEDLLGHPEVKNQRAYQIVFEAKVERGRYSNPTKLRVSEAMPPRSIDVSQGIFKSPSDEENWAAIQLVLAPAAAGEQRGVRGPAPGRSTV